MNVVMVRGRLSRPAEQKVLPSGELLVAYEVTVRPPEGKAESVPVVWLEAPASAAVLDVDTEVVVVGRVRRRFFRTAAGTQSRTEVVASMVVPARQAKKARGALERAAAEALAPAEEVVPARH